jgi:hypothetical protein
VDRSAYSGDKCLFDNMLIVLVCQFCAFSYDYGCLIMLTVPLSLIMRTPALLLFLNLHVYDDFFMFLII